MSIISRWGSNLIVTCAWAMTTSDRMNSLLRDRENYPVLNKLLTASLQRYSMRRKSWWRKMTNINNTNMVSLNTRLKNRKTSSFINSRRSLRSRKKSRWILLSRPTIQAQGSCPARYRVLFKAFQNLRKLEDSNTIPILLADIASTTYQSS